MRKDRNSTNRSVTKEPNWLLERGASAALHAQRQAGGSGLSVTFDWHPMAALDVQTHDPPTITVMQASQADDQRGLGVGILRGGKVSGPEGAGWVDYHET